MTCALGDKWRRLPQKLLHYRSQLVERQGFPDHRTNPQGVGACHVGCSDVAGEDGDPCPSRCSMWETRKTKGSSSSR